jgi:hypothetical protein
MERSRPDARHPLFWVHRIGAAVVALVLWAFAGVSFASTPGFVTTHGARALGMTGNGLLATISVVVGAILVVAAVLGGPIASTTCVVLGGLFLVSGLGNLFVLNGPANYLAFTFPNVAFSLVVGLVLLSIGLYGRASGQLPADNPYRQARGGRNWMAWFWHDDDLAQTRDVSEDDLRRLDEETELAKAEHALAEGEATPQQEQQVIADAEQRAARRRSEAWRRAGWNRSA